MGNMDADKDSKEVMPGDAAKLIRELRYGGLASGYLCEFYTPGESPTARKVFAGVKHARESNMVAGLHVVFACASPEGGGSILVDPPDWLRDAGFPIAKPYVDDQPVCKPNRVTYGYFLNDCGPGNKSLQQGLQQLPKDAGVRLGYGQRP